MRAIGIVLAGGNNHRMRELSDKRAVAAMPVAGSYRAIDFALSNMSNSHIQRVAVLTQYNARSLNEHLSSSKWWDFGRKQGGLYIFTPTITAANSSWYRGTADAIFQNLDWLKKSHEPYVIIASGDAVYKMDYNKILEYHIEKKADITVVCKEMPEGIPHIQWIYILNVVNSALSYFFIYKATLLFACQQKYVEMLVNTAVKTAAGLIQIGVLLLTESYFLYLAVLLCATLAQNVAISLETDRRYPYLREKEIRPLEREDKRVIFRNVTAMMFHKLGDVAIFSTDSILMAKFVSVASVGLYSNYMLIRKALVMVIDMLFSAITAGMGNLNASETAEKKRQAFRHVNFFSAWLFGWMSICLLWLYNPFIQLWLGADYLFPMEIVVLIVANFYLYCMRIPVGTTKNAMGLFWNDRYKPIAEVAVNLVASVLLAQRMGIAGVLLGTVLSTLLVPFWIEPLVLYRWGLEQRVGEYFLRYLLYLGVTAAAGALAGALCALTPAGLGGFVGKLLVCGLVPHLVYLAAYCRTEGFRYLLGVALRLAGRAGKRGGDRNG